MVNREAFGVRLNSPSLNTHTHTQRKELRTNKHLTFVFIRGHLLGLLQLA